MAVIEIFIGTVYKKCPDPYAIQNGFNVHEMRDSCNKIHVKFSEFI